MNWRVRSSALKRVQFLINILSDIRRAHRKSSHAQVRLRRASTILFLMSDCSAATCFDH